MNVVAVIVEQLEAEGRLKRLTMKHESGHQLEVAFPGEFDGEHSGPFFFPNERDEELFTKGFAECRVLKLSKDSFTAANGDYNLRIQRGGIPTEGGQLSYYGLSLPKFAVPTEVTLKDPHSNEPLYKSVFRDKLRKCFVIYVECRSSHGVFDFLLDVRFKIEKDKFGSAEYKDEYLNKYGGQINAYKRLLPRDEERTVNRFFLGEAEPQAKAIPSSSATGLAANQETLFSAPANEGDLTDRETRGKHCHEIIQEAKRIRHFTSCGLPMWQIRQENPGFKIWAVASGLTADYTDVFEHPNRWGSTVQYTYGLLEKSYGKDWTTVRDWVKAYRRRSKAKK